MQPQGRTLQVSCSTPSAVYSTRFIAANNGAEGATGPITCRAGMGGSVYIYSVATGLTCSNL